MAKDDLKTVDPFRKALANIHDGFKALCVIADLRERKAEPKPEFPPGTLVSCEGYLRIPSEDGLVVPDTMEPERAAIDPSLIILATQEHVRSYAHRYPHRVFRTFQNYARLVVSQEKPPELKGDDKGMYVVVEKRLAQDGEWYVGVDGDVVQYISCNPSAIPVWIVKPKE